MKILFTGVGRRIELLQAFRSAALILNKDLKIYGADMAGTAPALAYCDYTRRVVAMKDEGYIDNLLQIITMAECTTINSCHAGGDVHFSEISAIPEYSMVDVGYAFFEDHRD